MLAHPDPITRPEEIRRVAEALSKHDLIAYDTEFIRESTFYPNLEILQLATDGESWLVDFQAFRKAGNLRENLGPLVDVLTDKRILKIAHASQADQECLYTSLGIVSSPTFDTAIGAALCGYGDGAGLANLLRSVLDVTIKKGHARTNWAIRPLPHQQIQYAHADVIHLVALGRKLLDELDALDRRAWSMELSSRWQDPALHEPSPEELAERLGKGGKVDKKSYPVLLELMRWRETRVRKLNLPRRWVADDGVLLDLSHVRPKTLDHLLTFRGLSKGEAKNSGEQILSLIRKCEEAGSRLDPPRGERRHAASPDEARVLDLVKAYVGILADRHRIAQRYLVTVDQLLPILRSQARSAAELHEKGLLTEGASRLMGEELVALLQGKRALSVDRDRVRIVETHSGS